MKMKTKGYKAGGKMKTKGYKAGGKLPMVKDPKTGKMVPAFAADGVGKMSKGGKVKKMQMGGMMKTKGYKAGGKVRGCGMAKQGVRPAKMVTMKGS